jgi:hypothetical protein
LPVVLRIVEIDSHKDSLSGGCVKRHTAEVNPERNK